MGEVLQFRPREVTKAYLYPRTDGNLALAGPPNEPPSAPRKPRHLFLVKQVDDAPARITTSLYRASTPSVRRERPTTLLPGKSALPDSLETSVARSLRKERQSRPEEGGTGAWIDYFDTNWRKENLPQDWYHLKTQSSKRVGFIMNQQMDLLVSPHDEVGLADWVQKTKRDLQGFKLEFLTDNVVYPRKYFRNKNDSSRLEDPLYGKATDGKSNADIAEIVSDQERNGAVRKGIQRMKKFFESAPDGSIVVMTSPLGETGFKTQDGLAIDYPDSYFFIMQKNGDEVMNYTLKTDFKLPECREAILKLTGQRLPETASLEDYVGALALITPGQHDHIQNVTDVVNSLAEIKPAHAFVDSQNGKTTTWGEVHAQIAQGEALYHFDKSTNQVIEEFESFGIEGTHTKDELQKAIAVTILRMGEIFFHETETARADRIMKQDTWYAAEYPGQPVLVQRKSFGEVLEKTAERRGCAGGGPTITVTTMSGQRLVVRAGGGGGGVKEEEPENFQCPRCFYEAARVGNQCPGCGITKEQYAREMGGEVCD